MDRIITIACQKRAGLPAYSVQMFHVDLVQAELFTVVPTSVDATVKQNVQSICEPILKAQRKKGNILLGTTGIVALLTVILLVVLSMGGGENPDVDLTNADPDSTTASIQTEATEADETEATEAVE